MLLTFLPVTCGRPIDAQQRVPHNIFRPPTRSGLTTVTLLLLIILTAYFLAPRYGLADDRRLVKINAQVHQGIHQ